MRVKENGHIDTDEFFEENPEAKYLFIAKVVDRDREYPLGCSADIHEDVDMKWRIVNELFDSLKRATFNGMIESWGQPSEIEEVLEEIPEEETEIRETLEEAQQVYQGGD